MTRSQTQLHSDKSGDQQGAPNVWWAILVLVVITLLAFSNAAHDKLVLDDKMFVGTESIVELEDTGEAFSRDIWDKESVKSGLYLPLLLVTFDLETRLFGDWIFG